jgi:hypothetical protein
MGLFSFRLEDHEMPITHKLFVETMALKKYPYGAGSEPVKCRVELEINLAALMAALGRNALRNTSKKSKLAHGLIVCEVTPLPDDPPSGG